MTIIEDYASIFPESNAIEVVIYPPIRSTRAMIRPDAVVLEDELFSRLHKEYGKYINVVLSGTPTSNGKILATIKVNGNLIHSAGRGPGAVTRLLTELEEIILTHQTEV